MSASEAYIPDDAPPGTAEPLTAITVSRDVQAFDLLIEDMEAQLGDAWGDLTFEEAATFLGQPEAGGLRFLVVAVDAADEGDLPAIVAVVRLAKRDGLRVILVADGLSPLVMHELLRAGVDDFAPYPLPENALANALARANTPKANPVPAARRPAPDAADEAMQPDDLPARTTPAAPDDAAPARAETGRGGGGGAARVHAFQGIAGGVGATTLAVNVAWEAAFARKGDGPSVCVLDLGLQYGAVGSYLDLPRREAVYELLIDTASMDEPAFRQALQPVRDRIHVLTAPKDMLPLDLIGPEDVAALIDLAKRCFDVVVIDLPAVLTHWTDTVLAEADRFHVVTTLEVRCAQNALRLTKLLEGEGIGTDSMRWILNRAPGRMDLQGRGRMKSMQDTLGIAFAAQLPDGGRAVTDANDQALPLKQAGARTPLRREIAKLACSLTDGIGGTGAARKRSFLGLRFG